MTIKKKVRGRGRPIKKIATLSMRLEVSLLRLIRKAAWKTKRTKADYIRYVLLRSSKNDTK